MFDLSAAIKDRIGAIKIVDVGAMILGTPPYERLMAKDLVEIVGFEPIAEECAKLNVLGGQRKYLPYFVATGLGRHSTNATTT